MQELCEGQGRFYLNEDTPPALLERLKRDPSPAAQPAIGALVGDSDVAVFGRNGHYPAHAQLGCFLNNEIELVSFSERLCQSQGTRRFDFAGHCLDYLKVGVTARGMSNSAQVF